MIYYRDEDSGEVYAYEDSDTAAGFVRDGFHPMTPDEIARHLNPEPAYWTNGVRIELSAFPIDKWWLASQQEMNVLLPVMQSHQAEQQIKALRVMADEKISPLQDAADLGEGTAEEEAALLAWKRYRVALNRLPDQRGYPDEITWPVPPA